MNNFTFYSPTEFIFGKGTDNNVGSLCHQYGAKRVLVVYGGQSARKSGLLDRVFTSLTAEGLTYVELGGIQPNPTDAKVYEGITLVKQEAVDFVLAVGGGSVIDTAKSICAGALYDGDFWDFFIGKATIKAALPVAVVLTIPAAGSEGSGNAVITREATLQKLGVKAKKLLRPKFAVMNPELTFTLPAWQTASGIADMMAHILERYLSNNADIFIGERLCEGALLAIMDAAPRVMKDPCDYGARANIMWSGMVAHNDTCSCGMDEDWSCHAIEHELSALYDVTHGAGLAVMFPAFLTYMAKHHPAKVRQLAVRVFGVCPDGLNDEQTAMEGIARLKSFFKDVLHLPVTLRELGIENPDIATLVRKLHENKGNPFGFYYSLTPEITEEIYRLAM